MFAVIHKQPLRICVDGKAGRGKTFLVNVICDNIRSRGLIVLLTAMAAFAAQLYPGGRTTHSAFKVSYY
jgi:DNA replication protein DnaC